MVSRDNLWTTVTSLRRLTRQAAGDTDRSDQAARGPHLMRLDSAARRKAGKQGWQSVSKRKGAALTSTVLAMLDLGSCLWVMPLSPYAPQPDSL